MMTYNDHRRVVLQWLQQAVTPGLFIAASGLPEHHKCDIGQLRKTPEFNLSVGAIFLDYFRDMNLLQGPTLYLGGKSAGARHIVEAITQVAPASLQVRGIILEKDGHISGLFPRGARVILVEDVITSGKSALEALTALRAAGAHIEHAVGLLCRKEQGLQALHTAYLKPHNFFNYSEVLPAHLHPDVTDLF